MNGYLQRIGRWGEDAASEYLIANGYTIIERNHRTRHGEIDIIARNDDLLVFVEVKARTSREFGFPEEAVTPRKMEHMLAVAEAYLGEHTESGDTWQFDVIAVERGPDRKPIITHFENVIG